MLDFSHGDRRKKQTCFPWQARFSSQVTLKFTESVARQPERWVIEVTRTAGKILTHSPEPCCDDLYLPQYDMLSLKEPANEIASAVGFRIADTSDNPRRNPYPFNPGEEFYTGQYVWAPGIRLFTAMFHAVSFVFWLTPLGLVWAIMSRDWFFTTVGMMLLVGVMVISVLNVAQPRVFAAFYPFFTIVIGGMLANLIEHTREKYGYKSDLTDSDNL